MACGSAEPTGPGDPGTPATATYRVTFEAAWSAGTHPTSFPPNAHFSGLIGGTHSDAAVLWAPGGLASAGIKNMAETGSKTALTDEVSAAIQAGAAGSLLSGSGVNPAPGTVSLTFEAHEDFPLVSLVSMIAPSPDWFVGVHGLDLMQSGEWVESVTVELLPYDAGTDSGTIYTSPNSVTTPPATIQRLTGSPFDMNVPLGTFTFVRQ
ncbi:MAG: spondin domain-containing protein [Gemmatimonadota bacterium]|nr:spondin domain-containing protein [Gemmatimonadota bacterium]